MVDLDELKKIVKKYEIDEIALQSVVESCLETDDISYKKAQTAYLFSDDNSYSEKISNIKSTFNLNYAIQILSASKKIMAKDKLSLTIGILEVLKILKGATRISISNVEAKVLLVITENLAKTQQEIVKQVNKLEENDDTIDEKIICDALKNLEELGIIMLIDGQYKNLEKVIIEN